MRAVSELPIYLDHNATTPIAPEVLDAMLPVLRTGFGNPSSAHAYGEAARGFVERARGHVATLLECSPDEVIFTSGGTESNNLALRGVLAATRHRGRHLIPTSVEHHAVLDTAEQLEREGAEVTILGVDAEGRVDPAEVEAALRDDTVLVSVMHANNEVGTIQPIEDCAVIAREHGIPLHSDAAQSIGKIPTRVAEMGVDLLSIAGHKIYAPKGVGVLYLRDGVALEPAMHGADHESGRRAGTESALLTAALGQASVLAGDLSDMARVRALRDRFWSALQNRFGNRVALNGHLERRLPNTLNVSFVGRIGAEILASLDGVAASTGSACHAGRVELSPVLEAMAIPPEVGMGAVRFSLGHGTTDQEIDTVVAALSNGVLSDR